MMSGSLFARRAASFWHSVAPTSEAFVRKINTQLYKREFAPSTYSTPADVIGFVNEVAFDVFCSIVSNSKPQMNSLFTFPEEDLILPIVDSVWDRSRAFGRSDGVKPQVGQKEIADIKDQYRRIIDFFGPWLQAGIVIPKPVFSGCGVIDACEGDVLTNDCLFEVKAGRRGFRSADMHQLLVYAALHLQKTDTMLKMVGLFNPRLGISYTSETDAVCFEIGGKSARELIFDVIAAMSASGISR